MNFSENIKYIGVNDHTIDLFEGQYKVPNGMSYNSYVILDAKTAVTDTCDKEYVNEWLDNLEKALNGRKPDYLIVHHMEPDHSSGIKVFMEKYPDAVIVSSLAAFNMMKGYFETDYAERRLVVKEGSTLPLGTHTLSFIGAPMVHWPEVLMSYETSEKVLFSADGFGKFGALDASEPWDDEARRYYIGIVGKFGANVQAVLKKASLLDIKTICPLHGPVLKENLGHYIDLYNTWSSYSKEEDGVVIAYTSVYGNTKEAALYLASLLEKENVTVKAYDLSRDDMSEAVSDAFKYDKLVLATTTYNADIFPFMHDYIHRLTEHSFKNKTVGFIENGSWAPQAAKIMKSMLEGCADLNITDTVTIRGAVTEAVKSKLEELKNKLL